MKVSRKAAKEREAEEKKQPRNVISFKCPETGMLCEITDPTVEQIQLIRQQKITAIDLLR